MGEIARCVVSGEREISFIVVGSLKGFFNVRGSVETLALGSNWHNLLHPHLFLLLVLYFLDLNSIKSFLLLHSLALSCHFFFLTFSPLICKLFFGLFDTTSSSSFKIKQYNSWIDSVL